MAYGRQDPTADLSVFGGQFSSFSQSHLIGKDETKGFQIPCSLAVITSHRCLTLI